MIEQVKPDCDLEVDGGIDEETAPLAVAAGANVLVAGTSVFGDCQGVAAAMKRLKTAANSAVNKTQRIGEVDYEERRSTMQLGMIGLGRMGANMVRRLIQGRTSNAWSLTVHRMR